MGNRLAILGVILGALFGYLVFGLYRIQIGRGELYAARAERQIALTGLLKSPRGSIFMTEKDGARIALALNRAYPVIVAAPAEISDRDAVVETFADFLGIDVQELQKILSRENAYYAVLKDSVSEDEVEAVRQVGFKGIYIEEQEERFYPFESLAAHVVGFLGHNDEGGMSGQYGIEAFFEDDLKGVAGTAEKDRYTKPVFGRDIVLTIERTLEERAEDILAGLVENYNARGGTVIVAEPQTGKIRAFANTPTFDPNVYKDFPLSRFLNPAVQAIYEPGSILKVITMSAGIDSRAITPETTYTDYGEVRVKDRVMKNWDGKAYGLATMTQVLERSINTGAVFAEQKTGHQVFYDYLRKFGFGEKTGIVLPGELAGSLKPLEARPFSDVQYATASFGKGISVTPLQMLQAISAIANKGTLMKPLIIEGDKPQTVRRVISEGAARAVTTMMVSAVEKAEIARIPGYRIAGKTGTAQVPDFVHGGYTLDVINTYVGFGPASNPQIIVLVKLDKPAGAPLAGQTIVPAFRELMQFALNYYNIPPDNLSSSN